jgi:LmbE family N-acetylglucosaminyl deacetylase
MCIEKDMADSSQLLGRTMVVVAHPDDECFTCGALMQRMREPLVVYATDGAPRDKYFWGAHGTREAYAELRRQEARRALAQVGVTRVEFLAEDAELGDKFVDQQLFRVIPFAYQALAKVMDHFQPEALLTLAYEGGHPDHDTCNFLTAQLARDRRIPAWESALYHQDHRAAERRRNKKAEELGHPDLGPQHFICPTGEEITFDISGVELGRKIAMCREYASQGDFLQVFDATREVLRPMASYDYTARPHEGPLNYERWQWTMTGDEVCAEFKNFLDSRAKCRGEEHQHTTRPGSMESNR